MKHQRGADTETPHEKVNSDLLHKLTEDMKEQQRHVVLQGAAAALLEQLGSSLS